MTASFAPSVAPTAPEPIAVLREYRTLAPWSLRDLAAVAAAVLEASDVVPLNAAARARPTERTIRFYVTRGLVSPPEGRGTAAVYGYRHLLQVLAPPRFVAVRPWLEPALIQIACHAGHQCSRRHLSLRVLERRSRTARR